MRYGASRPVEHVERLDFANLDMPRFSAPALCAETDPEVFFPEKGNNPHAAKRVCSHCPVLAECREWALERHVPYGVWGGLSERDRRKIIRDRGHKAPRKTRSAA